MENASYIVLFVFFDSIQQNIYGGYMKHVAVRQSVISYLRPNPQMSLSGALLLFLTLSMMSFVWAKNGMAHHNDSSATATYHAPSHQEKYLYDHISLVQELVQEASELSGLQPVIDLPEVTFAPMFIVSQYACGGKCDALGAYHPQRGILIEWTLDPQRDLYARSILLHEIVHFLQDRHKIHGDHATCRRWHQREFDAYSVQNKFLARQSSLTRVGFSLVGEC